MEFLTYVRTKHTDQSVKSFFKLVLWLMLRRGSLCDSSLLNLVSQDRDNNWDNGTKNLRKSQVEFIFRCNRVWGSQVWRSPTIGNKNFSWNSRYPRWFIRHMHMFLHILKWIIIFDGVSVHLSVACVAPQKCMKEAIWKKICTSILNMIYKVNSNVMIRL